MRAMLLSAGLVFLVDQATKYIVVFQMNLAQRLAIDVWPPLLNFRMAWNQGINFGFLSADDRYMRWIFIVLALAVCAGVAIWLWRSASRPIAFVAGGVLIGGALGNVLDRILYGAVADFLNMSCCGIRNPFSFNVADIAIFVGAAGLVVFTEAKKTP